MDFSKIGVKLAENRPKISPLCEGWHGFLLNPGKIDQKLAKNQPFVRGLSPIFEKIGNFGENVARRAGLKK